jgi:hypothetical protein
MRAPSELGGYRSAPDAEAFGALPPRGRPRVRESNANQGHRTLVARNRVVTAADSPSDVRGRIMSADFMLESSTPSLLIIEPRASKKVVVGVPHHAPAGTPTLPCPEHENSDENAGFLGRYVAERLDCGSVIACNYTIDANKSAQGDYVMQIVKWSPKVLIEIHGHGGKKARHEVEISSGPHNDRYSQKLAGILAAVNDLRDLSICGDYSRLYFKAREAVTISDDRWVAYHIELPPALRKSSDNAPGKPPPIGYKFCDALIEAVKEIHGF